MGEAAGDGAGAVVAGAGAAAVVGVGVAAGVQPLRVRVRAKSEENRACAESLRRAERGEWVVPLGFVMTYLSQGYIY